MLVWSSFLYQIIDIFRDIFKNNNKSELIYINLKSIPEKIQHTGLYELNKIFFMRLRSAWKSFFSKWVLNDKVGFYAWLYIQLTDGHDSLHRLREFQFLLCLNFIHNFDVLVKFCSTFTYKEITFWLEMFIEL